MSPTHHSHLGVYAAILNEPQTHLLIIKKARGPYTGLYDLPGGSPEEGELLEQTLIREITEETGCTVTSYKQLTTLSTLYPHIKHDKQHLLRHIGILYSAAITGTPNITPDGHDSNGCVWLPLHDINKANATPFTNMAVPLLQKHP